MKKLISCLPICILATIMFSCNSGKTKLKEDSPEKTKPKDGVGLYVYIDVAGVLHVKNGCKAVYKDRSMQVVRPVNPVDVLRSNLNRICSQCVTEDNIVQLEAIISAREQTPELYYQDSVGSDY